MELRIRETGIRPYEYITSSSNNPHQAKGTIMQIRGSYPAAKNYVERIPANLLRDGFNNIEYFKNMDPFQRKYELLSTGTTNDDLYLEDVELDVKFIALCGRDIDKFLSPEVREKLINGNPKDPEGFWNFKEVYQLFPRKPGSGAKRPTLMFRPGNWKLVILNESVDSFKGMYLNLNTRRFESGDLPVDKFVYRRLIKLDYNSPNEICVVSSDKGESKTFEGYLELFPERSEQIKVVKPILEWATPGVHKSLIQKIIRSKCSIVTYEDVKYDSHDVLVCSILMLLLHPGSFVPNIQRFVTGMESAFKRVAVTIAEDSWLSDNSKLMVLFAAGLTSQRDPSWRPTLNLVGLLINTAVEAQSCPKMYKYGDVTKKPKNEPKLNNLGLCYILLKTTKSFEWDVNMLQSIALNDGNPREVPEIPGYLNEMPIYHAIDFHTLPEVVWYLRYRQIEYPELMKLIWRNVTGVNPRNINYTHAFENNLDFISDVKNAQRNVWLVKSGTPKQLRPENGDQIEIKSSLDPSWLPGLVGPLEVKVGSISMYVLMKVEDPTGFNVIKRPARGDTGKEKLTDEQKEAAINLAIEKLKAGVSLKNVPNSLPSLKGLRVYYSTASGQADYYTVDKSGTIKRWIDCLNITDIVPVHPMTFVNDETGILTTGNGITENADDIWGSILTKIDTKVICRLLIYLNGVHSKIMLNKVGRDGTGVEHVVTPEDTAVHHLLLMVCCLYPGALEITPNGFVVKSMLMFWKMRNIALDFQGSISDDFKWDLVTPGKHEPYSYQKEAIEQMLIREQNGKRGHGIWMRTGAGKTLIVIRYLTELIKNGRMPKYCVYTLPPSAVTGIIHELSTNGFGYQLLDTRKSGRNKKILPGIINLIVHDHLKHSEFLEQLPGIYSDLLFVVDEFHKGMADTQRTSSMLKITKLCRDFIALSATIVKNVDYKSVMKWLEQLVEFEVTPNNYWVAMGALISRRVSTGVEVIRTHIDCPLLNRDEYLSTVPKEIGGTSDVIDFKNAVKLSYESTEAKMLEDLFELLKSEPVVFVNARNRTRQEFIYSKLIDYGLKDSEVFLISKDNSIVLLPGDSRGIRVVISTPQYVEGYTITAAKVALTEVIFSNQANRDQWEGRLNRINQPSPQININIYHAGILSYVLERYEKVRSLAAALKGIAAEIGSDDLKNLNV